MRRRGRSGGPGAPERRAATAVMPDSITLWASDSLFARPVRRTSRCAAHGAACPRRGASEESCRPGIMGSGERRARRMPVTQPEWFSGSVHENRLWLNFRAAATLSDVRAPLDSVGSRLKSSRQEGDWAESPGRGRGRAPEGAVVPVGRGHRGAVGIREYRDSTR